MANDTPALVCLVPRLPTLLCCVGSAKGSAGGPNPNSSSGTFKGYVGMANDTPALVCLVPRLPTSLCVGSAKGSALAEILLRQRHFVTPLVSQQLIQVEAILYLVFVVAVMVAVEVSQLDFEVKVEVEQFVEVQLQQVGAHLKLCDNSRSTSCGLEQDWLGRLVWTLNSTLLQN